MPRATPVLWTAKTNKKGTAPIYLRLSDRDASRYVSLRVRVRPSQWNDKKRRVRRSHPNAGEINALIQARLAEAEVEILEARRAGARPTADRLKESLSATPSEASGDFLAFAMSQIALLEQEGRIHTAKKWRTVTRKLGGFVGKALPFDAVTVPLLQRFEAHLRERYGNSPNTVRVNLSVLGIIYRRSLRAGHVDTDPFARYKPAPGTRPRRPALGIDAIGRIASLDLAEGYLSRARDYFLFSFYMGGMRFGDVAKLRRDALHLDGRTGAAHLRYTQSKTGTPMNATITPPALAILHRYPPRGSSPFVFPMLDGYDGATPKRLTAKIGSMNAAVNKALKEVARRAEIEEHLTFHIARHSFSSLVNEKGWTLSEIAAMTGHRSLPALQRYLKGIEQSVIDTKMNELFG